MTDRSYFRVPLIIVLLTGCLFGQRWDVTLTSGQTYANVRIDDVHDGALLFQVDFYQVSVPVDAIAQVNYQSQFGLHLWGFLGGLAGGYAGYLLGKVFEEKIFEMPLEPREDPIVLFPTATGTVLGTVFGADFARQTGRAIDRREYDLSSMAPEERLTTIEYILNDYHRPFFLRFSPHFLLASRP
ncbi:MAG: hypothetical protein V3U24_09875 [Candidatus Neomarinimicrobiota bacterium]